MIMVLVFLWYLIGHLFGGSNLNNVSSLYSVTKTDKFPYASTSSTLQIPYFIGDHTKRAVS